jgi:hypothetical protein
MRLPSIREITGLFSTLVPAEDPGYLALYNESLAELARDTFPAERYETLNQMSYWADCLATTNYIESLGSFTATCCQHRAAAVKWGHVRTLCRAIAATELGLVLVDPRNQLPILNELSDDFVALAAAADDDDRGKRAQVLYAIAGYFTEDGTQQADQFSGLTPFLDDIAASEISAFGLTVTAEPEEIAR